MDFFRKKPTIKEQQRATDRAVRKAERDVERDRLQLEREEKKLEADIKRMAKSGNKEACKRLALQLVQLRKQKNRSYQASSQIKGVGYAAKSMGANARLAETMGETSKTLGAVNKAINPNAVARDMHNFAMENEKMNMTEEIMNDAFDDILADSDDEREEEAVIAKVLDEIGIEVSGQMAAAPSALSGGLESTKEKNAGKKDAEKEIEDMLAHLRA